MRVAFACPTASASTVISWFAGNGLTVAFYRTSGSFSVGNMVLLGEDLQTFLEEATDNGVIYVTQEDSPYGLGTTGAYDTLVTLLAL